MKSLSRLLKKKKNKLIKTIFLLYFHFIVIIIQMDKLSDINDYHYTVYILCMRHMNVSSLNNKQRKKKQICLIRLGNQIMRSIDKLTNVCQ